MVIHDASQYDGKHGIICIGASRSGTHMITDAIFHEVVYTNKCLLGEIYSPQWPYTPESAEVLLGSIKEQYSDKFIICSITQYSAKIALAKIPHLFDDYFILGIRRKDKVSQYISWCIFRAQEQANLARHSPMWEDYKHVLPWQVTYSDLEIFLADQYLDYVFSPDAIVYYEDVIKQNVYTRFKKMEYPVPPNQLVSDLDLVNRILGKFEYTDDI